ncbi:MAG: threonine--tRNA ligase [Minisyncoccia bacterium]
MKEKEDEKENVGLDKNDHRVIGKELGLFVFSDIVGKGLPLYTDKGATIRRELEKFAIEEEIKRGYKHVSTPDIAKIDLYKKSGHYPYYKSSMYSPIDVDGEEFMLRPMTCPHHFELYLSKPRSYRELPFKIAEIAKLYRYELSGVLTGIERTRSFCLSDAHIICTDRDQAIQEVRGALELISFAQNKFGLKKGEDYWYRLSLGDRKDDKKYYKDDKAWDEAEGALRQVLKEQDVPFIEVEDEAAFYGPKIDIQMKDVRGKEDTAFTVQYDFVMPKRFNLVYTNNEGKEKEAVVVHRSSIGSIERIMAFLIEKYGGNFPLWLSPTQVKIIPVRESHNTMSRTVFDILIDAGIRAEIDDNDENLGTKVRKTKEEKIPYWIVIGDKEVEAEVVTLESRDSGKLGQITTEDLLKKLLEEIKSKS